MNIRIDNIQKSFGNNVALESVSMTLKDKEFTTLLGPSGCGKTTLLRIIAGLEDADSGEIYFDDICVFSKEKKINIPPEKREIAFVFQDLALWPHMTVCENIAYGLKTKAGRRRKNENISEIVEDALRAVRLGEYANVYPHQLSGGQQQRVAFARAIAMSPRCILFDEPLSALDAILREEMRVELRRMTKQREITSVFVTHDQMEAMCMSDRIAVFEKGRMAQIGRPEEIYANPGSMSVAKFVGRSNWYKKIYMIRPEAMWVNEEPKTGGCMSFQMKVKDAQFLGSSYELIVEDEMHTWHVNSNRRYHMEEVVTIYIDETALLQF